jgi:small subunit ribosomal protein S4
MGRYIGPVCRLCRREGLKLFLKGERCLTAKCAFERHPYPAGMHGRRRRFRQRSSDYSMQLREKQKTRRVYGVMERQFRRYFAEAERQRGLTGQNLLRLLESRLDNIVYRAGFAASRAEARQLVRHGHFVLNGHRHNVPSYLVEVGDVIEVRPTSRGNGYFKAVVDRLGQRAVPEWLQFDEARMAFRIAGSPDRQSIDLPLNEQLIVEYYSR